jgi:hypothetical protein
MTTYTVAQHRVHLSKKFGLITHEQVLLLKGRQQEKIALQTISRVHLIKKRTYAINYMMALCVVLLWTVMGWNAATLPLWGSIVMAGLGTVLAGYAAVYRFHGIRFAFALKTSLRSVFTPRKGIMMKSKHSIRFCIKRHEKTTVQNTRVERLLRAIASCRLPG